LFVGNIFTKMYILFVLKFLIMEVICKNQWSILDITVQREKYSIACSLLATEIYVPYIITISRIFLFVLLQLYCQFHTRCFMVLQGGMHILTLVDFYGANYSVLILATFQIIGMSWIYGTLICKQLNTLNFNFNQLFLLR